MATGIDISSIPVERNAQSPNYLDITISRAICLTTDEAVCAIECLDGLHVTNIENTFSHGGGERTVLRVYLGFVGAEDARVAIMRKIAEVGREKLDKEDRARRDQEARRRESRQFMEVLRLGELGGGNSRQIRKRSRAAARSLGIAWATIQGRAS